ncbi:thrombomodulin-like [Archocentrus centrarchus]|uniref:thrombomodulin-like n=1 Tax=Archocentrus centrarchus TaxID=63155 RepID=UPI0011E9B344|nr:thrombomodulin-like [Archocentrus centrarchus]
MIPKTQTLLFTLVFLCRPREALLSLSGRCSKNEICAFKSVMDFKGAEDLCKKYSGELYKLSSKDKTGSLTALLSGSSGRYWLQSTDGKGPNCAAVSVMEGQNVTVVSVPCQDRKLDGVFCKMQEVCAPLGAPKSSPVTYTFMEFKFDDSEVFPAGTIAVAQKVGGNYPDSKHLCFTQWIKAPWSCEVMDGGCQSKCNRISGNCVCPPGEHLHHNNISCTAGPRAESGRECQQVGETFTCTCPKGYRLDRDGKSCVDVDECKEEGRCATGGQVCVNTPGDYECRCKERGFVLEEGVCVNVVICQSCEHDCEKINGEYQCVCRNGFMVSPSDPTKCSQNCTERDCRCISKDGSSCECPHGYVKDTVDGKDFCTDINECEAQVMCEHICENLFGGFRCSCREGFQLQDKDKCVEEEEDGDESGSPPPGIAQPSTPAGAYPALLPSYIKTGSVLGITVFIVLAAGLLVFLLRNAFKRCGKFELSSLKRPDIDIFYLQQVTTDTYKRLSFEKQFKSDSQKLELNL